MPACPLLLRDPSRKRDLWLNAAFPQCPPEPFEYSFWVKEPAFSMEHVTFGGWHDGTEWTLRGNAGPMQDDLEILTGDPEKYRAYAADYFEVDLPLAVIAHVLDGKKLDAELVKRITSERTLADLKADLAEIAY